MAGKIVLVIFAIIAGAAGAYGYEFFEDKILLAPQKEDPRVEQLQEQLAETNAKIHELSALQIESQSENELLTARLNSISEQLALLHEKKGELSLSKPQALSSNAGNSDGATVQRPPNEELPATPNQRISGEQLVAALKELPDEGKLMLRKAIHQEVQRIKKEQEVNLRPREKLEKKVEEVVRKLSTALDLAPVQVAQLREIGAGHIDATLETAKVAKERNEPEYARKMQKETEKETKGRIVEILTPEQLDKLRELDPEGIGKEYPRGF